MRQAIIKRRFWGGGGGGNFIRLYLSFCYGLFLGEWYTLCTGKPTYASVHEGRYRCFGFAVVSTALVMSGRKAMGVG